jgi:acylphosphatase
MEPIIVRKHIWVTGKVQGVGFRAYTEYVASNLGVTGWVRNVNDDQVEIVAEGEADILQQFVTAVQQGPIRSIVKKMIINDETARNEWISFNTRS